MFGWNLNRNARIAVIILEGRFGLVCIEGHLNPLGLIEWQLSAWLVWLTWLIRLTWLRRLDLLEVIRHTIQGQLGQQVVATEALVIDIYRLERLAGFLAIDGFDPL